MEHVGLYVNPLMLMFGSELLLKSNKLLGTRVKPWYLYLIILETLSILNIRS